jgi:hypothetical protein
VLCEWRAAPRTKSQEFLTDTIWGRIEMEPTQRQLGGFNEASNGLRSLSGHRSFLPDPVHLLSAAVNQRINAEVL